MILIRVWVILGYGGTRRYYRSSPISTAEEDEGSRSTALDKKYRLAETRDNKEKREVQEFRSNLKSRAKVKREFLRKLASGRHHGRGGGRGVRHGGGGDMSGAIITVRRHMTINGGTGMCLLMHQLYPLELVPLFTGGWSTDEREAGRNRFQ